MKSIIRTTVSLGIVSSLSYVTYDINNKIWSESHTAYTATYQYFLHIFMSSLGKYAREKFDKQSTEFNKIQEETLFQLLDKHKETALGRDLQYKTIKTLDDFREKVPLTDYNFYKDKYIKRIVMGEENIMTKDKVDLLGATSGTSGFKSLIPHTSMISKTFFLHGITIVFDGLFSKAFPQANQLQKTCKLTFQPRWTYTNSIQNNNNTQEEVITKQNIIKIGPASSSPDDKGFSRLLPLYSSPKEAFQIKNEKAAFYCHLLFALNDKNLGIIEANFSSIVLTFFNMLEDNSNHLIEDIKNGTLNGALQFGMDEEEVVNLKKYLKPNPARALQLKNIFIKRNYSNNNVEPENHNTTPAMSLVRQIWPHLNCILTVTTGAFRPYADTLNLKYVMDSVPFFSPLYAATEGLIGVNISPEDNQDATYALLPQALFYEFLEVASNNFTISSDNNNINKKRKTLLSNQLEIGRKYELVITNLAGLVRYRFGDVVKLERFENETPIVSFQYRQGQVMNVRGEKMNENILTKAIKDASSDIGLSSMVDFCASEDLLAVNNTNSNKSRYHIFIEIDSIIENDIQEGHELNHKYDCYLQKYSEVYKSYRKKEAIEMPIVHILPKGAFEALRSYILKENSTGSITQLKIPRVLKVRKFVQFLLERKLGKKNIFIKKSKN